MSITPAINPSKNDSEPPAGGLTASLNLGTGFRPAAAGFAGVADAVQTLQTVSLDIAAIKVAIGTWADVPASRRRNWASAFATAERIIRRVEAERPPPAGIDCWSCNYLNTVLWVKPPAFHGLNNSNFTNIISALRQILIRLGHHADAGPRRNVLAPEWSALHAALPTHERRIGIVRFLRFLTLAVIEPDAVTAELLERFETWLRTETLTENIPAIIRRTASNWLWARQNVPGWPEVELRRPRMRDHYTVPIEQMPTIFQADVENFLKGLKGTDRSNPFRNEAVIRAATGNGIGNAQSFRRSRAVSPETIVYRRMQIRAAVAALIDTGIPRESFTGLRDLVTPPERPKAILQFHLDRLKIRLGTLPDHPEGWEPTSTHVAGISGLLRIIAVYHARLPEDEIMTILDLRAAVRPPAQGEMNESVARKLRALNNPDVTAALLYLPESWISRLPELGLDPYRAALQAMYAVALEIALAVPLRRRNLIGLHCDRHLVRDRQTGRVTGLDIPAAATKTRRRGIVWEFSPRLTGMIDRFEREFLPILAGANNRFLFPGLDGKPREKGEFANELAKRVEQEIGVDFNLHLVRHLTAYRILKRQPGAYELVSRVLGHASPKTTMQYYCGLEMIFAVREAARLLELDRVESRPSLARAVAAQQRLRSRRRQTPTSPVAPSREPQR